MISGENHSKLLQFLLLSLLIPNFSASKNTITPNQSLKDGQTLLSPAQTFELGFFQPDPSSNRRYLGIWYKISNQTVVRVANRQSPLTTTTTGLLNLTADGNLLLSDHSSGQIFWSTNTSTQTNPSLQLLDSGNLVLLTQTGLTKWQSFDHPTDTLLAGMKMGWDSKLNQTWELTSWSSPTDPAPGAYTCKTDPNGSPEGVVWNGSNPTYRTGPWDGHVFDGLPGMISNKDFAYRFVSSSFQSYYEFDSINKSLVSVMTLTPAGVFERRIWLNRQWRLYWWGPYDQCDTYGECGNFGVCRSEGLLTCQCVQGFEPVSSQEWALRDTSSGCGLKVGLECGKSGSTDGFVRMSRVKLPDSRNWTVNGSLSLEGCRRWCLEDCSCTAFAISGLMGCVMWSGELMDMRQFGSVGGEDLYVRVAASEIGSTAGAPPSFIQKKSSSSKTKLIVILISVFGVILLVLLAGLFLWIKKRKRGYMSGTTNNYHSEELSRQELELPVFDISTIEKATDAFSAKHKLGEGGFGLVYKGKLEDGQEIAVKKLSKGSLQGLDEFKNEVLLIAKLQHRNLVRLLGCCIQGEEPMLIYEYLQNKSLDAFIFDKDKGALLDWRKRLNIIMGIARGLLYLHQDSRFNIIHRDLKTSNILLDKDMNPKISDFGTARMFKEDQLQENTKRVIGTYGYMSPEYALSGMYSVKSDVFSFGVIVLEILSGKKNRVVYEAEPHMDLLGKAWSLWTEGKSVELLDESLECPCPIPEILRCIQIGLLCCQERRDDRPTMSAVVLMLGTEAMVLPQPETPGFCIRRPSKESNSSSTDQSLCTTNEITVTMVEGR